MVSLFKHLLAALHLQNRVQGNFERLQLHLMVLQGLAPSQLHLINVIMSSGANVMPSATVVGSNVLDDSSLTKPYSRGSIGGGSNGVAAFPNARLQVGSLDILNKRFC